MSDKPETITIDDVVKLDLRVARVVEASEHPNADKLLLLKLDVGGESRQICAGLRGYYEPEQLVGKNIVIIANLAPRMMRGEESQGMLLAASTGDRDSVVILTTERDIASGSAVN